jgi:hypothetical protein
MTEERKKEAFGMKLKERKDEIIALYLSRSHTHHPLFSAQQTWNEKKEEWKIEREQHTKQNTTPKFSQMSKGIPYWVQLGMFLLSEA